MHSRIILDEMESNIFELKAAIGNFAQLVGIAAEFKKLFYLFENLLII